MTDNLLFQNPEIPLSTLKTFTDALEMAYLRSLDGSRAEKEVLYLRENVNDELFKTIGQYVDKVADGDSETIYSSGFQAKHIHQNVIFIAQDEVNTADQWESFYKMRRKIETIKA